MATLTLYPTGVGDYTYIVDEFPDGAAHWSVVDEAVVDDTDFVRENPTVQAEAFDVYTLTDTTLIGVITAVTVYFRARRATTSSGQTATPRLVLGASTTTGTPVTLSTTFTTYSEALARPGGGSWAFSDINSLQAGVGLKGAVGNDNARCSQVYVEVTYTPATRSQGYIL